MCNRFLIFAILKTDDACYELRFFSLAKKKISQNKFKNYLISLILFSIVRIVQFLIVLK